MLRGVGERLDSRKFGELRSQTTFQTGTHDVVLIDDRDGTIGTERRADHREPPRSTDRSTLSEAMTRFSEACINE